MEVAHRFKFKGTGWLYLWLVAIELFCATLSFVAVERHQTNVLWVPIPMGIFLGTLGFFTILSRSDVIVDESGLHREWPVFGGRWQTIQWENVRRITAFPVSIGFGRSVRGFNIFPKAKIGFGPMPSGKMFFGENMEQADQFIALLNIYVQKYHITIEPRDFVDKSQPPADH